jgi:hypothetical protein
LFQFNHIIIKINQIQIKQNQPVFFIKTVYYLFIFSTNRANQFIKIKHADLQIASLICLSSRYMLVKIRSLLLFFQGFNLSKVKFFFLKSEHSSGGSLRTSYRVPQRLAPQF